MGMVQQRTTGTRANERLAARLAEITQPLVFLIGMETKQSIHQDPTLTAVARAVEEIAALIGELRRPGKRTGMTKARRAP